QHLGEVHRAAQRAQEHRRSQPQMRRVSRGIREEDDGLETGHPSHDLLDDPRAVKSERFGSSQHLADSPRRQALRHARLRKGEGQRYARAHAAERYQGGATVYSEQPARDSRRGASMSGVKDAIARALDRVGDELEQLSRKIHDHPELGYQEVKASGWLADFLGVRGFKVEHGIAGVDTAFRATLDTGDGPTVAIMCEYDALPGIGHACGHNVIAA